MISGIISNNQPFISIVVGWQWIQQLPVLVDTGFTGELKVPLSKVLELGLQITHAEPVLLANNTRVYMRASLARVLMEDTINVVNVLISDGIPTIGVGLLKRFRYTLSMDFRYNILSLQK